MADLEAFYRVHLKQELRNRKARNSRYSIRAFAKSLSVDNGYLSKLLSGKALLSLDLADQISRKLRLPGELRRDFLLSAADEQRCHALYLIEPTLTDCDLKEHEQNLRPTLSKKR
jgi:transcriptional regulator with XRE-family HTH domain